ncbi:MAG: glycosyl transferase family 1 [Thermodesulfobacteriota bacterium]|nr:MAG: glycosyl transferase family 1 [Thermodesulfobacteriota bacterium]
MSELLSAYAKVAGQDAVSKLQQLAAPMKGKKFVHVNSTRVGGGVAEILMKMVPLMNELGIDTSWEVITGEDKFYQCTKSMHNALQGDQVDIADDLLKAYEETNFKNAEELRPILEETDYVIIHDPQPAPLLSLCPNRRGKWVWRCHIDASKPHPPVWNYLSQYVKDYDASYFSLADYAQQLPHTQYLIPPSIDPLSEKNMDLDQSEIESVYEEFDLDRSRPIMLQVSRYDRFKDPIGVIEAYKFVKESMPEIQLVLAGGGATDDPEGEEVLREVRESAGDDPDIHILLLPPDAHVTINALQRASDIILQKSLKEGFGLTVTEAMWKGKPVIGGNTGGIRLQIVNHHTGFLVDTPEGAALRIQDLLQNPDKMEEIGKNAKEYVRENFLNTRHLREILSLFTILDNQSKT